MEILLAIVVAVAVIFFGALISMGNERQRKAIDGLHDQVVNWAIQDLRIKRDKLARDVQVDDPLVWLSSVASKVSGLNLNLTDVEFIDDLNALVCINKNGNQKIVFSPYPPKAWKKRGALNRNRLDQLQDSSFEPFISGKSNCLGISILNGGILFDIELPLVWKQLTRQEIGNIEKVWMYV